MSAFAAQAAMMQQQMMMMQQCAMMQRAMGGTPDIAITTTPVGPAADSTAGGSSSATTPAEKMKQAVQYKKKLRAEKDEKITTVFVGGLRKSTSEDKVAAHFAKFGQVDNVDIKRLPDGTSRGFAFVKFMEKEAVDKVIEARSSHMIDNKWVAVRPHGGSEFNAQKSAETERAAASRAKEKDKEAEEADVNQEDYEDKWSEKYLSIAAQVGAMQKDKGDSVSTTQALDMLGKASAQSGTMGCMAPMGGNMGGMNNMANMANMANMGMMNMMGMMGVMNPMMGMMMNPAMMGMMGQRPVGAVTANVPEIQGPGCSGGGAGNGVGGGVVREHTASERYQPY
mmetsp:Transcript_75809/g.175771  ORF Transcript_75809/g.175771 Transcript_75809/m.175771 type:complete len:339 (+) Transcript_75809:85-1101(+)